MQTMMRVPRQRGIIVFFCLLVLSLVMVQGAAAQSDDGPVLLPIVENQAEVSPAVVESSAMSEADIIRPTEMGASCVRTIHADVVALDQPFYYNRLGALNANGMMYALKRDVVAKIPGTEIGPGNVMLRPDKRPRPIVLRANEGDCLEITFTNWLDPNPFKLDLPAEFPAIPGHPSNQIDDQPNTRAASIHIDGMFLVGGISADGSNVGANSGSGLVNPGETTTYTYFAHPDYLGAHLMYSMGSTVGAEGAGGTRAFGLFGAVNEQPAGSRWYRSQLTRQEMDWATTSFTPGSDGILIDDLTTEIDEAADNQPILNYEAVYPEEAGPDKAGLPIINMLNGTELVHSDLNAIISGQQNGSWSADTWPNNRDLPDRNRAFREFTVIFHDETFAVQAFPSFYNDPTLSHTLHGVVDGFPINYGSGGIGSEIIANRLGVGPMWDCTECKYEEFFLTSFTVGDPAMIVDIPANFGVDQGWVGPKATAVAYPDDPSNVHHSYLNDRIIFRNLHAGPKEHHIFHLHAHQWFFNENEAGSNYHDSQAVGPGSAYTYEIAYGGSGNRNKTVGDSIFHCHFYPHFAQGMWELWRTHDVFERGTEVTAINNGGQGVDTLFFQPVAGARALPDGEISAGTPIPAVVPLPGYAMAPMPDPGAQVVPGETVMATDSNGNIIPVAGSSQFDADGNGTADIDEAWVNAPASNPGYPFFIPGQVGHRPPTPIYDMDPDMDGDSTGFDGGLPRHVVTSGPTDFAGAVEQYQTRLDFNKILHMATAVQLPEWGTAVEQVAMAFHADRWHPTYDTAGNPMTGDGTGFETNGLPPQPGAPFADPCRNDNAGAISVNTTYKAANIQMDVTLNKVGWHFQQQRFETLWKDVLSTLAGTRPPEPLVMRLNSKDCAEFWHTNLVPNIYELDDYQVRTPTDIIGQHIHLVKFDVTSADGSANGWNYEDGTLSPDEVQERIHAFNAGGFTDLSGDPVTLEAQPHPEFGLSGQDANNNGEDDWLGARTTIQRWYADPLLERSWDGGLGTVFTHDHYGPSTHQQVGLYSTVLIEPYNSVWRDPETGVTMGTRVDGGPTSWRADILTEDPAYSHREFYLEFADFQHAYEAGGGQLSSIDNGAGVPIATYADFDNAINPSFRQEPPQNRLADLFFFPEVCPGGGPRPCPEAISADDPGTYVVNYRNEPIALRVFDPQTGTQATGQAGDLAHAFSSNVPRAIDALNNPPDWPGALPGDPYTPLLPVYQGDQVRIRAQVGAHEEEHNITFHGLKWKQELFVDNSGYRNSQFAGISEYFNLDVPINPDQQGGSFVDYFYTMGAQVEDLWNGIWGIMRAYKGQRNDLLTLPNNPIGRQGLKISNANDFIQACPKTAYDSRDTFDITVVAAKDVLPGGTLVYNSRGTLLDNGQSGQLHDPTAMMYVMTEDLTYSAEGRPNGLKPGTPVEPLVLRANAGACIEVNLRNGLPTDYTDMPGFNALPPIVAKDKSVINNGVRGIVTFNANDLQPSLDVGLNAQLVSYDVAKSDGANIGANGTETVAIGATPKRYLWYAGDLSFKPSQQKKYDYDIIATPIEYGTINLRPADMIKGSNKGLVGALIIEPLESCWVTDPGSRVSASVWQGAGLSGECASLLPATTASFREFVTIFQDDVNLRYSNCGAVSDINCAVANIAGEGPGVPEDPQDSGQKAINYGTEPLWYRLGLAPNTAWNLIGDKETKDVFSNDQVGGDPQTAVFTASPNGPNGKGGIRVRLLEPGGHARGHVYTMHGHAWQRQPYINGGTALGEHPNSWWIGAQEGFGPSSHWDLLINPGGPFDVIGDFLFRDQASAGSLQGLWGLFRYNTSPPMAGADVFTTDENVALEGNVLVNDMDLDGDGLAVQLDGNVPTGALQLNANGTFLYTPVENWSGIESFTYRTCQTDGQCSNPSTVTITVNDVNNPPVANADDYTTDEGFQKTGNVLTNDTDPEGDPLTAILALGVSNGALEFNADGTFTYTPSENWFGSDSFAYKACQTAPAEPKCSADALVTLTVNSVNDAPVANDDTATTPPGTAVTINVLANDSDVDGSINPGTVAIGTAPASGEAVVANADGTITYTPVSGTTSDSFTYTVADDLSAISNEATVTITVADVPNQTPVANDDTAMMDPDSPVTINVLVNDADSDGAINSDSVTVATAPSSGAAVPNADGTITYTPVSGTTSDSFTYTVADDLGATSNEATVTITVATPKIHVGDLDAISNNVGKTWHATVTITIHSESGGPVSNAVVNVDWSNGDVASCTTGDNGQDGQCFLTLTDIPKKAASVTMTVTNVSLAGHDYDADANRNPDNDNSNGTSITVGKP